MRKVFNVKTQLFVYADNCSFHAASLCTKVCFARHIRLQNISNAHVKGQIQNLTNFEDWSPLQPRIGRQPSFGRQPADRVRWQDDERRREWPRWKAGASNRIHRRVVSVMEQERH